MINVQNQYNESWMKAVTWLKSAILETETELPGIHVRLVLIINNLWDTTTVSVCNPTVYILLTSPWMQIDRKFSLQLKSHSLSKQVFLLFFLRIFIFLILNSDILTSLH